MKIKSKPWMLWFGVVGSTMLVVPLSAADTVFEDREFVAGDWSLNVFTGGYGGTATAYRELSDGGYPSPFRVVRITVNAPSATVGSVVQTFSAKLDARHDPSKDGEIFAINYSDDSRHISPPLGGNNGFRVNIALKQGTNFFSAPVPVLYASSDVWTPREQNSLRAADFAPMTGSLQSARPDFSTNGTEILFGFARSASTPAGTYPNSTPGTPVYTFESGIDNWRVELLLTDPGTTAKLPKAGRSVETYAIRREHPTTPNSVLEARDKQFEPAPIADPTQYLVSTTNVLGVGAAPGLKVARAEARIGVFAGVRTEAQGGATIQQLQPLERRSEGSARDIRHFVATASSGATEAEIKLWMVADGFFELMPLYLGNPWEPYYEQLTASAEQSVILHRESQIRTIMRGAVKVFRAPGNPSIRYVPEDKWVGAVSLQFNETGAYRRPTLDYSEVLSNIATVPVGEPFALEFRLRAESKAGNEAADWLAVADLYNTAGYTVQSSTPGVQIIEITPVAFRPRLGIRRVPDGFQVFTVDDPGPDEFMVEFSTGFGEWDDVGMLAPAAGEWRVSDPETPPPSHRFYRAIRRQLTNP